MNLWFTESKLEDYTFMYDLVIELFYQEVCFLHKELIKGWYINSQYMPQYSSEKNHTIKFVEYLEFRWWGKGDFYTATANIEYIQCVCVSKFM